MNSFQPLFEAMQELNRRKQSSLPPQESRELFRAVKRFYQGEGTPGAESPQRFPAMNPILDHRRRVALARIERCEAQLREGGTPLFQLNVLKQLYYSQGYLDALDGKKP